MLIELKMDTSPDGALRQILDNNYPKALEDYKGPLILCGITYDRSTKKHSCRIGKFRKDG